MRKCDYCDEEIEYGYLIDDYCVMCEKCKENTYTKEEFNEQYEKECIFWTTFYD